MREIELAARVEAITDANLLLAGPRARNLLLRYPEIARAVERARRGGASAA